MLTFVRNAKAQKRAWRGFLWGQSDVWIGVSLAIVVFSAIGASRTGHFVWWIIVAAGGAYTLNKILMIFVVPTAFGAADGEEVSLSFEDNGIRLRTERVQEIVSWAAISDVTHIQGYVFLITEDSALSTIMIPASLIDSATKSQLREAIRSGNAPRDLTRACSPTSDPPAS